MQEAAGTLIECLMHEGDPKSLYDAERYAQLTLESLKDKANKIDQEGEEIARCHYNLAQIILLQNGDLVRAERLARESLRIRGQLYVNDHFYVGSCMSLLGKILNRQGRSIDEVEGLFQRSLAILVKQEGPNALTTAIGNHELGQFYLRLAGTSGSKGLLSITTTAETQQVFNRLKGTSLTADERKEHLQQALVHFKESVRIHTKTFGSAHSDTVCAAHDLNMATFLLSEIYTP